MQFSSPRAKGRPDDPQLADAAVEWSAAYVHVPFCARVCPYCDFAVVGDRDDLAARYVAAVRKEIYMEPEWRPLDSVYVGGGTPSRLAPDQLASIVDDVSVRFGLTPGAEVTLEANPEDWNREKAEGLRSAGFNRVSFGVQSFDLDILKALGRLHTPDQAAGAVGVARRAGFRSINLDLIFGTPGESESSWVATLDRALELEPEHLSLYALTVERGTELSRSVAGGAPGPDPDQQADAYETARRLCEGAGLIQYEVSNWARPDHACIYNLVTWAQGEYLAFGNGAHGHRSGVRRRNYRRLEAYLRTVEENDRPEQGTEQLGEWEREQERLLLGLRRTAGASPGIGGRVLLESAAGDRLQRAGVLGLIDGRIVVARPLLGDEVGRAVLALQPGER